MWIGHKEALGLYMNAMIHEWEIRGYQNSMPLFVPDPAKEVKMPQWMGDNIFHSSHRAALLAKDPEYYSQFNWAEKPVIEYFWPV